MQKNNRAIKPLKEMAKPALVLVSIVAVILTIVVLSITADSFPDWTGLTVFNPQATGEQRAKTLWDWLDLLLVPIGLAILGYSLNRIEKRRDERHAREVADTEEKRAQDAALQSYLDHMTHLLLEEDLRHTDPNDEKRAVARGRTLTVLRILDPKRKASVIQFLHEAGLINGSEPIIGLHGADLRRLDLRYVYFGEKDEEEEDEQRVKSIQTIRGVNFTGAFMEGANLRDLYIPYADFSMARLTNADLSGVFFKFTKMKGAKLTNTNLTSAYLRLANLERAKLTRANMQNAILDDANLSGSDLTGANLTGANLRGANLMNCEVTSEQLASAINVGAPPMHIELKHKKQALEPEQSADESQSQS